MTGRPRVFFVAPLDGEAMSSDHDVEIEFGAENYTISAIPEGFDAETDEPRADMGHYHVGLNTGCLPAGEVIPEGQNWQHFGDGSNRYTLQVEPGSYELSVQIGGRRACHPGRPLRDHQHRDCRRDLDRSRRRRPGLACGSAADDLSANRDMWKGARE